MDLAELFQASEKELGQKLPRELQALGYTKIRRNKHFVYAEGDIPILLVAHMDTVFYYGQRLIFHDQEQGVMWSPQGLGADDRAGIWAILEIVKRGYKPHILFTTEEETGCRGARQVIKTNLLPAVKYVIQLDRKGFNDCVFYDCGNEEFIEYVQRFGFKLDYGTFTDISVLCPAWNLAGVNLSVGYFQEHYTTEYLSLHALYDTIERVCTMLEEVPEKSFDFQDSYKGYDSMLGGKGSTETVTTGKGGYTELFECEMCGVLKLKSKESPEPGYCRECYERVMGIEDERGYGG